MGGRRPAPRRVGVGMGAAAEATGPRHSLRRRWRVMVGGAARMARRVPQVFRASSNPAGRRCRPRFRDRRDRPAARGVRAGRADRGGRAGQVDQVDRGGRAGLRLQMFLQRPGLRTDRAGLRGREDQVDRGDPVDRGDQEGQVDLAPPPDLRARPRPARPVAPTAPGDLEERGGHQQASRCHRRPQELRRPVNQAGPAAPAAREAPAAPLQACRCPPAQLRELPAGLTVQGGPAVRWVRAGLMGRGDRGGREDQVGPVHQGGRGAQEGLEGQVVPVVPVDPTGRADPVERHQGRQT